MNKRNQDDQQKIKEKQLKRYKLNKLPENEDMLKEMREKLNEEKYTMKAIILDFNDRKKKTDKIKDPHYIN